MKINPATEKMLSDNIFPVVGIGASAGGLDAFKKLLKAIPEDSGMAYVLVQHLDPKHESLLPDLLQKVTNLPVLEITHDMKVEPNHIYVIPSNKMMVANDGVLELIDRTTAKNERNLPIDLFFHSLAEVHQSHSIGVVLSGTASDGTSGLKAIKDHGGITFAQDEKSAAYDGMPNSAVQAGVVDFILSPEAIPAKIMELNKHMNSHGYTLQEHDESDEELFRQIISLLRVRKGTDFTYYKKSTVHRRILRRMALSKNEKLASYLNYLRENKTEQDILYQDILIPVTSFFRDQKSFDNLEKIVFPIISKHGKSAEPLRVWIAGCSTGEEVYSMAISLQEYFGENKQKLQIFATDINDQCILKARAGMYNKKEVEKLTLPQIKKYFTRVNGDYQVNKSIRDVIIFAVHNFLKDPPFSKMDLISCRNVFIYMEPYLQKKALAIFHYALNKKGFLMLGKSESISGVTDLFKAAGKNDKLFTRKDVPTKLISSISKRSERDLYNVKATTRSQTPHTDFQKTADDIILSKYTPVGVVVNEMMDIVHYRGSTGNYLEHAPGKPTNQVFRMVKSGLAFDLRNLLYQAKKKNKPVLKSKIPFKIHGHDTMISMEAIPLPNMVEPHYLILFHEVANTLPASELKGKKGKKGKTDLQDKRIEQLKQELEQTHEDMRSITEDQEAANEELQSSNEELLSSSEETQSLNEELETSKEELQSTNEELIVVNQELINLNEHLTEAKEYAEAIISTINEPLLVLDKNLRVKTVNQSYYTSFRTQPSQVEGKLIYELDQQHWDMPQLRKLLETILPEKSIFNDLEITQTFSSIGERVMLLNAREIKKADGAEKLILLAIKDITDRKNQEQQIQELLQRFQNLVAQAPVSICIIRKEGYVVELANDAYLQLLHRGKEFINQPLFQSIPELVGQGFQELLDTVMRTGNPFYASEMEVPFSRDEENRTGFFSFYYQPRREHDGRITGVIAIGYEVTDQVIAKRQNQADYLTRSRELEEKVQLRTTELKELNELLWRENEDKEKRAAELAIANKELALQNEEKEKRGKELVMANQDLESFSYVASHDLQEPLRKIQTFAKMIIEKELETLSDVGKDYFQRMSKAANRMQVLIDDLLTYSQSNTKVHKFELSDLTKILQDVISDYKEIIDEKKAIISYASLGEASVIPFQFRQILQNLIGNALKFSSTDRHPQIVIKSEILPGRKIVLQKEDLSADKIAAKKMYYHLSVSDNGIGFDPQFQKQIFELFQRLHGKDIYSGTGIGLAIVKKIVDNHHGIVIAKGVLDEGATFDIYFPELNAEDSSS